MLSKCILFLLEYLLFIVSSITTIYCVESTLLYVAGVYCGKKNKVVKSRRKYAKESTSCK